jgi:hypothetical protein
MGLKARLKVESDSEERWKDYWIKCDQWVQDRVTYLPRGEAEP